MGHYYANDINLDSNIKKVSYTFKGNTLTLNTDNGVFCKDHIDFGSNVLLKSLPDLSGLKSALDVGCGYGLIGLSVAKGYPNLSVDMVDVNLRAISLSINNKSLNTIKNAEIFESNIYQNVTKKYDVIITNPPIRAGKSVVHGIVIGGIEHLNDNGSIYVVIQKKQGAPSLIEKMEECYSEVNVINKEKGYFIIEGKK